MNFSTVNYGNVHFKSIQPQQQPQQTQAQQTQAQQQPVTSKLVNKIDKNNEAVMKYPPAAIGLINGFAWAFIGMGFDKIFSKIAGSKSSGKTSLVVNGIIGAVMGTYAFIQAKKMQNKANAVDKMA